MLIRDLTIQGYRCFEDFSMDGLTRVNLLVGNNNSGKTSFLEAVYLLANQPTSLEQKPTLFEILENRGEFKYIILSDSLKQHDLEDNKLKLQYVFDYIYYRENDIVIDDNRCQSIFIKTNKDREMSLSFHISKASKKSQFTFNELDKENIWRYLLECDNKKYINLRIDKKNSSLINSGYSSEKDFYQHSSIKIDLYPVIFQSNYIINANNENFFKLWDHIALTPKEDFLIKALKIIDNRIERLGFTMNETPKKIRVKLNDKNWPIPLNSMGDGINRILSLAMALVSTEKGVLLVDEIETGLHYEAQLDMWRLVLKTAQDLDVQVFATTHSWDCIAAFKEALQELEDQSVAKLFRLDSKYGKLRAVEYDAEDIRVAVDQGIEVR